MSTLTSYSPLAGESKRRRRFGGGVTTIARRLRKQSTPWEIKLWHQLKSDQLGASFRRQQPLGPYIADFICFKYKLIIELDGSQHQKQTTADARRDDYFAAGYQVLRFWNNELATNFTGVMQRIAAALAPHQNAARFDSPARGE